MLDQNDLLAIAKLMDTKLEPINTRLDTMDARLDTMDARLDTMDARLNTMDARLNTMDARLDKIEEEARHTRVLIENQDHKIKLIAEQHSEIIEKLSVTSEVDSLKGRVSTLEGTVKTHTTQIMELKKAQ